MLIVYQVLFYELEGGFGDVGGIEAVQGHQFRRTAVGLDKGKGTYLRQ